jgi:hypothetical protein
MEEAKRRIQGFSDATAAGGAKMEEAYQSAASYIGYGMDVLHKAYKQNEADISKLQSRYGELKKAASDTFAGKIPGGDAAYRQYEAQAAAIERQMAAHRKTLSQIDGTGAALEKYSKQIGDQKDKIDKAANAQARFGAQLMQVKNEMMRLQLAGKTNTEEFGRLTGEATRLQQAINIANKQIRNLANPGLTFQGVISAVSGVAGAFTAAQGVIGLFGEKNEDLQKIMLKVQSLMAITMGLQQVNNTLLSTSALRLGIVAKAQQLWTAAQAKYAAVQRAVNIAAAAGTVANKGLATSFKMVSLAIKSIPGIGWLLAAITALVAIYTKITGKAREAGKAQEEFYKSVAENASKPIAEFRRLQSAWENAGDSFQKKMSVIKDLKKMFEELGVSINGVIDAEKILTSPSNINAFISAQIAKARATAKREEVEKLEKEAGIAQQKLEDAQKTPKIISITGGGMFGDFSSNEINNPEIAKWAEALKSAEDKMTVAVEDMVKFQKKAFEDAQKAIEGAIITYSAGTVGALEQAIKEKQDALEGLKGDNKAFRKTLDEIAALQKQLDKITGKNTGGGKKEKKTQKEKDPVTERMEQAKKAYQEYFKWINAGYQNEAKQEFSELLKGGKTYLDYLKKMREDTGLTKEQIHQITNEIAQETNETILGEFENGLKEQLNNAQTVIDTLNVIKQQREELAKSTEETDPLKSEKEEIIKKQEEDVVKKQEETTKQLIAEYSNYTDKALMLELELTNDLHLLEAKRAKAATEEDKQSIDDIIRNRKQRYNEDKANLLSAGYEAARKLIDLGQDRELLNISKKAFLWEADRTKAMLEVKKQAALRTLEELQQMQKEAQTDEIAAEIKQLELKIEELNAELKKMPNEKFQEMLSGLQKITGALGNLDGEAGEIFSNISSQIDNLKVAFDRTASKAYKISAGIAAVVDIINMVVSASEKRKKVEKEFYQNQIALAHEYTLALNGQLRTQSELAGSGFITDYAGKINDGFKALTGATKNYQDALDKLNEGKAKVSLSNAIDWGNVGKGVAAGAAAGAVVGSVIPVIGTVIGAAAGAIVGGLTGFFGAKKKKNDYGGLLEVFPELVDEAGNLNRELAETLIKTNQLDDETEQLIQNALDWADAVEEANKQMEEVIAELAGDVGNSLKTALIDAWKAGEDASKKMFEAAGKSLERFIEEFLWGLIMNPIFEEFKTDLKNAAENDGILDEDEIIAAYDKLMDGTAAGEDNYLKALEYVKNRAKERGFDLWTPDEDASAPASLSGAIKGASQESINLLAGQTNAVRVNQVESMEILRNSLIQLTMINANTNKSSKHLESIDGKMSNSNIDPLRSQGLTG